MQPAALATAGLEPDGAATSHPAVALGDGAAAGGCSPSGRCRHQLAMIRDAGFDGAGVRFIDPAFAAEVTGFLRAHT